MDIILCILGAAFSGFAFISENTYPLLLFAPALFYLSLYNEKHIFLKGFLFGSVFYMFNSVFLSSLDVSHITSSHFFQKLIPFIGYVIVFLIEGIFTGLFSKAFIYVKKRTGKKTHSLVFSSLWIIYEYLLSLPFMDTAYPFGRIAIPFAECPYFIQTSSLFGMLFISFIIIYFASSLAMSLMEKNIKYMFFPCLLLILNCLISSFLYSMPESGDKVSCKCVQNGYGGYEKWLTPPNMIIEDSLKEFSSADIVIFAESAIPLSLNKTNYLKILSDKAKENNVTVLMGSLYKKDNQNKYTSIYLLPYSEGEFYHKRHPVPFGEYYPILNLFSTDIRDTEIKAGKEAVILSDYRLGPIICFDSMFPQYSRETVKKGASLLCVSTNDSWFSKGNAALLHLYHSVFRSVENGRYTARSACTGISAIIDTKGNILKTIPLNSSGFITADVILSEEITPYTLWGDFPLILYAVSIIVSALFVHKRRLKDAF